MGKGRLEAFSDGVIAIIITIMVLELHVPRGADWAALAPLLPVFLAYVLSFIYVGIYWNNHHHMLHAASVVDGCVLWANLNLLFWLSLIPFATGWMGQNHFAPLPVALYGDAVPVGGRLHDPGTGADLAPSGQFAAGARGRQGRQGLAVGLAVPVGHTAGLLQHLGRAGGLRAGGGAVVPAGPAHRGAF